LNHLLLTGSSFGGSRFGGSGNNKPIKFDTKKLDDLDVNATSVNLYDSDITSDDLILIVERLKEMPNLVELHLMKNQITSIDGLSELVGLTRLDLGGNHITSIKGLSGLVGLTTLQLYGNQITSIEGLSELVGLSILGLRSNQITSIEGLSELVGLTYLALDKGVADPHRIVQRTHRNMLRNKLDNLDVNATKVDLTSSGVTSDDLIFIAELLKEMPNLVKLNLRGNQITSVEGLSGLVGLTYLNLSGNQITSIEELSGLVGLTTLELDDGVADPNRIVQRKRQRIKLDDLDVNATSVNLCDSDITSDDLILIVERLKEMPNLVELELDRNQITSIEGLSELVGLTTLKLYRNQITSIEGLSGLVGLTTLRLSSNKITSIEGLSGLVGLTRLDLNSNQIMSIEGLSGLVGLTTLRLSSNKITSIEGLSGLVGLTRLDLNSNQINEESLTLFLTMRITNNRSINFQHDGKKKLSWSTIAATIIQAIERNPNIFLEKDKEGNLPLATVCGFDHPYLNSSKFELDPSNLQAHLATCQLIYLATSPTATDNGDRDRTTIATSAINPEVRRWAKSLGAYLTRYRIDDGPPIHKSATCRVVFAEDLLYNAVPTNETKNQPEPTNNNKRVAIKIMKNHNEFTREITSRYGTNSEDLDDCTIKLLGWHIPNDESRVSNNQLRTTKERPERTTEQEYVLVMEMGSASLFLEMVSQRIAGHNQLKVTNIFRTIVQRVQQLHSHLLIHSDIKPRNVLRMPDENIVLCDLDAALLIGTIRDETFKSSSAYCPPELARSLFSNGTAPIVTDKFDVWSLGVVLFELCTGQHLFSQDISDDNMTTASDKTKLCLWNCISDRELSHVFDVEEAKKLIRWCLMGDPIKRPT
jgi:Leucine-rich repeat (LRR) protein